MCIIWLPGAHEDQKKALDPLERELHMVVKHHILNCGVGIEPGHSFRGISALNL